MAGEGSSTVEISIGDITDYVKAQSPGDQNPSPVTDWMALGSQINVSGLSAIHKAFQKNPDLSLEEIRAFSKELLKDLEMLSKRQDMRRRKMPIFQKEFGQDVDKPPGETSEEYEEFLETYAQLDPETHAIEAVSAKLLMDLDNPDLSAAEIRDNLKQNLQHYKDQYSVQTTKDLAERTTIFFKGPTGVTRPIAIDQLRDHAALGLSKEQSEFILTSWQQGSFESGWFNGMPILDKNGQRVITADSPDRTQILIEASEGSVVLRAESRMKMIAQKREGLEFQDSFRTELEVNITGLKGESFTPGCASSKVPICARLTPLNSEIPLPLPKDLPCTQVTTGMKSADNIRDTVIGATLSAFDQAVLEEDMREAGKHTAVLSTRIGHSRASELTDLGYPHVHERLVRSYCDKEQNPDRQKDFAFARLGGFLEQQKIEHLSDKTVKNLTQDIVTILSPCCKSSEIAALKKNTEEAIRSWGSDTGTKMSLSQSWKRLTDKLAQIFSSVRSRENQYAQIMSQAEGVKNLLREKLKQAEPYSSQTPPVRKVKENQNQR